MFKKAILAVIKFYRKFLSPLKGKPSCRFYPTCSQYAMDAISKYGAFKGTFLAILRILKCHPFHPGGYDPVK
jgi:putative membrane protein insertion efficiency factor